MRGSPIKRRLNRQYGRHRHAPRLQLRLWHSNGALTFLGYLIAAFIVAVAISVSGGI